MSAVPVFFPVTSPFASTAAIPLSDDFQVTFLFTAVSGIIVAFSSLVFPTAREILCASSLIPDTCFSLSLNSFSYASFAESYLF